MSVDGARGAVELVRGLLSRELMMSLFLGDDSCLLIEMHTSIYANF